ncbi:hypothetical protein TWF718_000442 [Orbilia javanica]|uniref:Nucleoside phosphorylase domain-containing protein n=1 Tax=Orbilia javanica TaxID=47235 RepID=A0AAN8RM62_9PEZI
MVLLESRNYTVGLICALPLELAATTAMLDEVHEKPTRQGFEDKNNYDLGRIGPHNAVIACLPDGTYGTAAATALVVSMLSSYKAIRFCIMVGIGGGVPSAAHDIRLGDVIVSKPRGTYTGVIQYDYGKAIDGQIVLNASSNKPPKILLTAVASLAAEHMKQKNNMSKNISTMLSKYPNMKEKFSYRGADNDQLYEATYNHVDDCRTCHRCDKSKLVVRPARNSTDPEIFYGNIGSGNLVMKDGVKRDELAGQHNILCFEMEAAGLMDHCSCLVIRGVCDYADSHKNKDWQEYSAATAAAYAKELLCSVPVVDIDQTSAAFDSVRPTNTIYSQMGLIDPPPLPSPAFILTNRFYPKNSISLGSIVPDRRYPNQDALTAEICLEEGSDFSLSIDKNFSDFVDTRAKSDSVFKQAIIKLFLLPLVKGVEGDIQVFSEESCVYLLQQPRELFKRLCDLPNVKSWLEDACVGKRPVYFIVGYRTVLNARFVAKEIKPPRSRRLPPGVGQTTRYNTTGERIYAICYRKVKFENLKKGRGEILDSTNEWRMFSHHRDAGTEEDQIVVVDISSEDEKGKSSFGIFPSQIGAELWTGI